MHTCCPFSEDGPARTRRLVSTSSDQVFSEDGPEMRPKTSMQTSLSIVTLCYPKFVRINTVYMYIL
jgi:hypothetical protein